MWNVGEEEELGPVWCRLSTSQWLFVSYRETPEGLLLFIYLFLRGITQVGDYRAACNGNWPGFASRLHANGAAGLQRGGCRPQHLCGGSSSNNPSLSVSLLVWGRFKFAFVELWFQRPLNLKMTCFLPCGSMHVLDRRTCDVGQLIFIFTFSSDCSHTNVCENLLMIRWWWTG